MPNSLPPLGWETLPFDDSAWPHAVALAGSYPNLFIWCENPPLALDEIGLARYHFTLPAGSISTLRVGVDSLNASGQVYVNGVLISSGSFSGGIAVFPTPTMLIAGGANVLAILCQLGGITTGLFFDITVT